MLVDINIDGMFVMNAGVGESTRCGDGSDCLAKLNIFNEKTSMRRRSSQMLKEAYVIRDRDDKWLHKEPDDLAFFTDEEEEATLFDTAQEAADAIEDYLDYSALVALEDMRVQRLSLHYIVSGERPAAAVIENP